MLDLAVSCVEPMLVLPASPPVRLPLGARGNRSIGQARLIYAAMQIRALLMVSSQRPQNDSPTEQWA